ncbi:MAG: hypothetical protein OXQ31_09125 [Spirochaetaceae bacterium]|nr:hypothetical protein [Spirochaetaceae bacterium]
MAFSSSWEADAGGAAPAVNATAPAADHQGMLSRVPFASLALLLAVSALAQDLPVLTFTYETAQGVEEDDEEVLEPTYIRHTLLTSARQDLGDAARLTLPVRLTSRSDPREPAEGPPSR